MRKLLLSALAIAAIGCTKPCAEDGIETGSIKVSLNLTSIKPSGKTTSSSKGTSTFEHQYDGHELVIEYNDGTSLIIDSDVGTDFTKTYDNLPLGAGVIFVRPKTTQNEPAYVALGYTTPEVPINVNLTGTTVTLTQVINIGLVTFDLSQLNSNVISDSLIVQTTSNNLRFRNNHYLYFADGHTPIIRFYDSVTGLDQEVELAQISAKVHNHYIITSDNNVGLVVDDEFTQTTTTLKN